MIESVLFLALVAQLNADVVDAASDPERKRSTTPVTATYVGSDRQLDVAAPHFADPEIRLDGRLDDPAWAGAALLTGFTQYEPVEGSPASERTHVRVLVSDEAIYFAIRADDASGGVRATLTERDGFARSDDYVRIVLDTFHDQRRAYVFMVNPYGVQGDGLWVEGGGGRGGDPIDWSPDFLWGSAGQLDDTGYSVEVRIPIKSLRFPEREVQDWGLQVQRSIRRTGFEESWAPITRDRANRLAQSGSIRGLRGLDPGMFLEINSTLVGSRQGSLDELGGALTHDPTTGEVGLNVTYGLTSNLVLDGTVNPDFSQIEADASQIAVNERFALFLPEQRPFFLEGADVFSMPQRLVYTRSIVNPVGAAKISGKVGSFNVAYLGAVDEVNAGTSNPIVNLVRFKRDLGRSSSFGMVYTDRTEPGVDFNRVAGADARLVLGGRYTVELLAAGSADGAAGLGTDWGHLVSASLRRSSRTLSLSASFEDVGSGFRAGSGFIRRTGVTEARARTGYTFRGSRGAFVESWGPSFEAQALWERDAFWAGRGPLEHEFELGLSASLRGNIGGFLNYRRAAFDFAPSDYAPFYIGQTDQALQTIGFAPGRFSSLQSVSLRSWIGTWERVRGSFGGSWSETPIFAGGVPIDLGVGWSGDVGLTVYPTGSTQAEFGVRHVTLFRQSDGSRYSSATIPRLQLRYQLSRAAYIRGIGEYSTQERGEIRDAATGEPVYRCSDSGCRALAGSEAHDFRVEALLGYEPSPGTVFFLGYTRQFRDAAAFGFDRMRPVADGLFAKLSYRFRM